MVKIRHRPGEGGLQPIKALGLYNIEDIKMANKERLFYDTLKNIFVGEKIEGQGGYVNLMRIKSKYYERLEKILKQDIEKATEKEPSFKEELYDKLYTFFKRYFNPAGCILFNETPYHYSVYERIYTDDKDMTLFYKTKDLYYIKTDRLYREEWCII